MIKSNYKIQSKLTCFQTTLISIHKTNIPYRYNCAIITSTFEYSTRLFARSGTRTHYHSAISTNKTENTVVWCIGVCVIDLMSVYVVFVCLALIQLDSRSVGWTHITTCCVCFVTTAIIRCEIKTLRRDVGKYFGIQIYSHLVSLVRKASNWHLSWLSFE